MKIILAFILSNFLSSVLCQTSGSQSSKIQWQANLGSTGSATDTAAESSGRKSANVELPGVAELPKPPAESVKNGNPPAITPVTDKPQSNAKTNKDVSSTKSSTVQETRQTPTTPAPATTMERTTRRTTIPTKPTPPPTQPPTTKAAPVIMVQHSLSGVSGPSNIISEATDWIDTTGIYRFPSQTTAPDIKKLSPRWPPPKLREYWPTLAPLLPNNEIVTPSSIEPTVPPLIIGPKSTTNDQSETSSYDIAENNQNDIRMSKSSSTNNIQDNNKFSSSSVDSSVKFSSSSSSSQSMSSSSSSNIASQTTSDIFTNTDTGPIVSSSKTATNSDTSSISDNLPYTSDGNTTSFDQSTGIITNTYTSPAEVTSSNGTSVITITTTIIKTVVTDTETGEARVSTQNIINPVVSNSVTANSDHVTVNIARGGSGGIQQDFTSTQTENTNIRNEVLSTEQGISANQNGVSFSADGSNADQTIKSQQIDVSGSMTETSNIQSENVQDQTGSATDASFSTSLKNKISTDTVATGQGSSTLQDASNQQASTNDITSRTIITSDGGVPSSIERAQTASQSVNISASTTHHTITTQAKEFSIDGASLNSTQGAASSDGLAVNGDVQYDVEALSEIINNEINMVNSRSNQGRMNGHSGGIAGETDDQSSANVERTVTTKTGASSISTTKSGDTVDNTQTNSNVLRTETTKTGTAVDSTYIKDRVRQSNNDAQDGSTSGVITSGLQLSTDGGGTVSQNITTITTSAQNDGSSTSSSANDENQIITKQTVNNQNVQDGLRKTGMVAESTPDLSQGIRSVERISDSQNTQKNSSTGGKKVVTTVTKTTTTTIRRTGIDRGVVVKNVTKTETSVNTHPGSLTNGTTSETRSFENNDAVSERTITNLGNGTSSSNVQIDSEKLNMVDTETKATKMNIGNSAMTTNQGQSEIDFATGESNNVEAITTTDTRSKTQTDNSMSGMKSETNINAEDISVNNTDARKRFDTDVVTLPPLPKNTSEYQIIDLDRYEKTEQMVGVKQPILPAISPVQPTPDIIYKANMDMNFGTNSAAVMDASLTDSEMTSTAVGTSTNTDSTMDASLTNSDVTYSAVVTNRSDVTVTTNIQKATRTEGIPIMSETTETMHAGSRPFIDTTKTVNERRINGTTTITTITTVTTIKRQGGGEITRDIKTTMTSSDNSNKATISSSADVVNGHVIDQGQNNNNMNLDSKTIRITEINEGSTSTKNLAKTFETNRNVNVRQDNVNIAPLTNPTDLPPIEVPVQYTTSERQGNNWVSISGDDTTLASDVAYNLNQGTETSETRTIVDNSAVNVAASKSGTLTESQNLDANHSADYGVQNGTTVSQQTGPTDLPPIEVPVDTINTAASTQSTKTSTVIRTYTSNSMDGLNNETRVSDFITDASNSSNLPPIEVQYDKSGMTEKSTSTTLDSSNTATLQSETTNVVKTISQDSNIIDISNSSDSFLSTNQSNGIISDVNGSNLPPIILPSNATDENEFRLNNTDTSVSSRNENTETSGTAGNGNVDTSASSKTVKTITRTVTKTIRRIGGRGGSGNTVSSNTIVVTRTSDGTEGTQTQTSENIGRGTNTNIVNDVNTVTNTDRSVTTDVKTGTTNGFNANTAIDSTSDSSVIDNIQSSSVIEKDASIVSGDASTTAIDSSGNVAVIINTADNQNENVGTVTNTDVTSTVNIVDTQIGNEGGKIQVMGSTNTGDALLGQSTNNENITSSVQDSSNIGISSSATNSESTSQNILTTVTGQAETMIETANTELKTKSQLSTSELGENTQTKSNQGQTFVFTSANATKDTQSNVNIVKDDNTVAFNTNQGESQIIESVSTLTDNSTSNVVQSENDPATMYLSGSTIDASTNMSTDFNFSISMDALFVDNENITMENDQTLNQKATNQQMTQTSQTPKYLAAVEQSNLADMDMFANQEADIETNLTDAGMVGDQMPDFQPITLSQTTTQATIDITPTIQVPSTTQSASDGMANLAVMSMVGGEGIGEGLGEAVGLGGEAMGLGGEGLGLGLGGGEMGEGLQNTIIAGSLMAAAAGDSSNTVSMTSSQLETNLALEEFINATLDAGLADYNTSVIENNSTPPTEMTMIDGLSGNNIASGIQGNDAVNTISVEQLMANISMIENAIKNPTTPEPAFINIETTTATDDMYLKEQNNAIMVDNNLMSNDSQLVDITSNVDQTAKLGSQTSNNIVQKDQNVATSQNSNNAISTNDLTSSAVLSEKSVRTLDNKINGLENIELLGGGQTNRHQQQNTGSANEFSVLSNVENGQNNETIITQTVNRTVYTSSGSVMEFYDGTNNSSTDPFDNDTTVVLSNAIQPPTRVTKLREGFEVPLTGHNNVRVFRYSSDSNVMPIMSVASFNGNGQQSSTSSNTKESVVVTSTDIKQTQENFEDIKPKAPNTINVKGITSSETKGGTSKTITKKAISRLAQNPIVEASTVQGATEAPMTEEEYRLVEEMSRMLNYLTGYFKSLGYNIDENLQASAQMLEGMMSTDKYVESEKKWKTLPFDGETNLSNSINGSFTEIASSVNTTSEQPINELSVGKSGASGIGITGDLSTASKTVTGTKVDSTRVDSRTSNATKIVSSAAVYSTSNIDSKIDSVKSIDVPTTLLVDSGSTNDESVMTKDVSSTFKVDSTINLGLSKIVSADNLSKSNVGLSAPKVGTGSSTIVSSLSKTGRGIDSSTQDIILSAAKTDPVDSISSKVDSKAPRVASSVSEIDSTLTNVKISTISGENNVMRTSDNQVSQAEKGTVENTKIDKGSSKIEVVYAEKTVTEETSTGLSQAKVSTVEKSAVRSTSLSQAGVGTIVVPAPITTPKPTPKPTTPVPIISNAGFSSPSDQSPNVIFTLSHQEEVSKISGGGLVDVVAHPSDQIGVLFTDKSQNIEQFNRTTKETPEEEIKVEIKENVGVEKVEKRMKLDMALSGLANLNSFQSLGTVSENETLSAVENKTKENITETTISSSKILEDKMSPSVTDIVDSSVKTSITDIVNNTVKASVTETTENNFESINSKLHPSHDEIVDNVVKSSFNKTVDNKIRPSVTEIVDKRIRNYITVDGKIKPSVTENVNNAVKSSFTETTDNKLRPPKTEIIDSKMISSPNVDESERTSVVTIVENKIGPSITEIVDNSINTFDTKSVTNKQRPSVIETLDTKVETSITDTVVKNKMTKSDTEKVPRVIEGVPAAILVTASTTTPSPSSSSAAPTTIDPIQSIKTTGDKRTSMSNSAVSTVQSHSGSRLGLSEIHLDSFVGNNLESGRLGIGDFAFNFGMSTAKMSNGNYKPEVDTSKVNVSENDTLTTKDVENFTTSEGNSSIILSNNGTEEGTNMTKKSDVTIMEEAPGGITIPIPSKKATEARTVNNFSAKSGSMSSHSMKNAERRRDTITNPTDDPSVMISNTIIEALNSRNSTKTTKTITNKTVSQVTQSMNQVPSGSRRIGSGRMLVSEYNTEFLVGVEPIKKSSKQNDNEGQSRLNNSGSKEVATTTIGLAKLETLENTRGLPSSTAQENKASTKIVFTYEGKNNNLAYNQAENMRESGQNFNATVAIDVQTDNITEIGSDINETAAMLVEFTTDSDQTTPTTSESATRQTRSTTKVTNGVNNTRSTKDTKNVSGKVTKEIGSNVEIQPDQAVASQIQTTVSKKETIQNKLKVDNSLSKETKTTQQKIAPQQTSTSPRETKATSTMNKESEQKPHLSKDNTSVVSKPTVNEITPALKKDGVTPPKWLSDIASSAVSLSKTTSTDFTGESISPSATGGKQRPSSGQGLSSQFQGIDINTVDSGSNRQSSSSQSSGSSNDMQSFVGMLSQEQKNALMAMLGGSPAAKPVTTTPKPTTAPKPDMNAMKMKMMQAFMSSMGQGGMGGMGAMVPGMPGMGGMDAAMMMEALGGGSTDAAEQMTSTRRSGRERMRGMGGMGLGGRGGRGGMGAMGLGAMGMMGGRGLGSDFANRDPMMQKMLLERQLRSRRPGHDPSEAREGGLGGEAMMGGSGMGGAGGGDMASLMGMGGMTGLGGMGGGGDMSALLGAMGGGMGGAMGGGGSPDMMALMAAMAASSAGESSGSSSNSTSSSSSASDPAMDMSALFGSGMGGIGGMGGMGDMTGMSGGMGNMAELQMMASLMGGGADLGDAPATGGTRGRGMMGRRTGLGMFGMKKRRSAGPGPIQKFTVPSMSSSGLDQNMLTKPSSTGSKSGTNQQIPDWLMKKLVSTNNAIPRPRPNPPTTPPPTSPPTSRPASSFDPFATSQQANGGSTFTFGTDPTAIQTGGAAGAMGMPSAANPMGMPGANNPMGMPGATNPMGMSGATNPMNQNAMMNAMNPISANMSPAQIETMFTAIGLIPDQIRDISGGAHGMASMLPEDIKIRAIQMRATGSTPDQIADILGDVMQARARRAQMPGRMAMAG